MIKYLFFLFSFYAVFGQNPKVSLQLMRIEKKENEHKTHNVYTITATIKNNTENPITFFFDTNHIVGLPSSSLSNAVAYQVYDSDKAIPELRLTPSDKSYSSFDFLNLMDTSKKYQDSISKEYKKNGGKKEDISWILKNHSLKKQLFQLDIRESKTLTYTLYWDKIRNLLDTEHNEIYLEENKNYFLDLHLVLIKKYYVNYLEKEEYTTIEQNPNFIEGYFYSNKLPIEL